MNNKSLISAKTKKDDEFYTLYTDIDKELSVYKDQFAGKIVYCNCDDPNKSNFPKWFIDNFNDIGLKGVVATCYDPSGKGTKLEYFGNEPKYSNLYGDGDFRSDECLEILNSSDIVASNPPFSLFKEYIGTVMESGKKFIVIGNKNTMSLQKVFDGIVSGEISLGSSVPAKFITPDGTATGKVSGMCRWFTNLDNHIEVPFLELSKKYRKEDYPEYENYSAIEVGKVKDIPSDYYGVMGVPTTFLDKYNPKQFSILGKGGDLYWAVNNCRFYTPPSKEKSDYYKSKNSSWRIQNPYYVKNGSLVNVYQRIFIERIL